MCLEAVGEAKVEWMTSSDIQASDEEVFNFTTVLPIKGEECLYRYGFNRVLTVGRTRDRHEEAIFMLVYALR